MPDEIRRIDPKKKLVNIAKSGKPKRMYLPVKTRIMMLRDKGWEDEFGVKYSIMTRVIEFDFEIGFAAFICEIRKGDQLPQSLPLATGHKMVSRKEHADFFERAETGAIGRAAEVLGYGTEWATETDEANGSETRLEQPEPSTNEPPLPTKEQIDRVVELMQAHGITQGLFLSKFGSMKDMTPQRADEVIFELENWGDETEVREVAGVKTGVNTTTGELTPLGKDAPDDGIPF